MKLYKCILTDNRCFRTGTLIKPKGVMVHSTGANNPNLKRYVQPLSREVEDAYDPDRKTLLNLLGINKNHNDWNRGNLDACVHGFIGKLADGSVAAIQTLPWNARGWHAGMGAKGSANDSYISFEMCEDDLMNIDYFKQVYQTAVELTATLCDQFALDPLGGHVIICHQDGYRLGIASNHGDIYNWFPKHGKTMNDFRHDVKAAMAPAPIPVPEEGPDMVYYETFQDIPTYYQPAIQKVIDAGALKGVGGDKLNVSEDFCRTMTVLDRMGKLDPSNPILRAIKTIAK